MITPKLAVARTAFPIFHSRKALKHNPTNRPPILRTQPKSFTAISDTTSSPDVIKLGKAGRPVIHLTEVTPGDRNIALLLKSQEKSRQLSECAVA